MYCNTTGKYNTATGHNALNASVTVDNNTATGYKAMYVTTAHGNTATGSCALFSNTSGATNTVVGYKAAAYNTTAHGNTVIGYNGMNDTTTGGYNTALGYQSLGAITSGTHNTGLGIWTGSSTTTGSCNIFIGKSANTSCSSHSNQIIIGVGAAGAGTNKTVIGNAAITNTYICGALSKGSGTFLIPHPDPAKTETKDLQHSFVESPTEGDNLYRWSVEVTNSKSVIELPDYYRHLNKDDMVWTSPVRHFGNAYGVVTPDQKCLEVCATQDGCYNVLLIGTRKDPIATRNWTGIEPDIHAGSPSRNLA
jgi:hypothetical protein